MLFKYVLPLYKITVMEKTSLIQIRVSPTFKAELIKRANDLNMNMTAYIIYLAMKDLKKI